MVKREELMMFIERRILATLLQLNEPQTFLAYWAWELPMNTPDAEYPIGQEVMQGVVVPNMLLKLVFVARSYVHTPSSQALTNSSITGSMYTPISLPGCPGIINDKNIFCL
jgi:hypothetical protein